MASADLSLLITEVSNLIASGEKPQTIVRNVRAALIQHLGASRVQVFDSETQIDRSAKFLFSHAVSVRGVEYGTLQVDLQQPVHTPHLLLKTLETVALLLANFAERSELEEENTRLRANRDALEAAIAASKVVSRAAGVVAKLRTLSFESAQAWLQAESARTRRPLVEIAERVLLFQDSKDRLIRTA